MLTYVFLNICGYFHEFQFLFKIKDGGGVTFRIFWGVSKKQWPAELSRIKSLEIMCVGFVPVWIRGVKCPKSAAGNSSAVLWVGCGGIGQRLGEAW